MAIQSPTGVFDILPVVPKEPWRAVHLWQYVEDVCKQLAFDYGFSEIRTPMFERAELFVRSIGDETDVVSKEMYIFKDRGDRELALRPEGTASVIRALVAEGVFTPVHALRYFYIGPMFRYERPQAGRFRQHHQFGVEVFGVGAPEQDAELIAMMMQLYHRLGLPHLKAYINSLGDSVCRAKFREALLQYLAAHLSVMSEDSQRRFERNPLRILDSKDQRDQQVVQGAPSILDYLSTEDAAHFQRVQELLSALNIPFEVSPLLVRGLDYYQRTVFEVTSGKLGSQNTVGGGGRYDGLLKQLGGPDLPSIGYGCGLERIIHLMMKEGLCDTVEVPSLTLVILPLDEKSKIKALMLSEDLRRRSVRTLVDFSGKKMKQAIPAAVEARGEWLLVLGERELETGKGSLKYLADGSQTEVSLDELEVLAHLLNSRHAKE
jgi:histidyl-tRNA synthetase